MRAGWHVMPPARLSWYPPALKFPRIRRLRTCEVNRTLSCGHIVKWCGREWAIGTRARLSRGSRTSEDLGRPGSVLCSLRKAPVHVSKHTPPQLVDMTHVLAPLASPTPATRVVKDPLRYKTQLCANFQRDGVCLLELQRRLACCDFGGHYFWFWARRRSWWRRHGHLSLRHHAQSNTATTIFTHAPADYTRQTHLPNHKPRSAALGLSHAYRLSLTAPK